MPTITIDASQLFYDGFWLLKGGAPLVPPGASDNWIPSRDPVDLDLQPDQYAFNVFSGETTPGFRFTVDDTTITIDGDPPAGNAVQVPDPTTLIVSGLAVQIDGRFLYSAGHDLVLTDAYYAPNGPAREIPSTTPIHLLPNAPHQLTFGAALPTPVAFTVEPTGAFGALGAEAAVNNDHDIAAAGYVAGGGTSRLDLLGYPLMIDAREAGASQVGLFDPKLESPGPVLSATVLPMNAPAIGYGLTVDGNWLGGDIYLAVQPDGAITPSPALAPHVQTGQSYKGIALVRLTSLPNHS